MCVCVCMHICNIPYSVIFSVEENLGKPLVISQIDQGFPPLKIYTIQYACTYVYAHMYMHVYIYMMHLWYVI